MGFLDNFFFKKVAYKTLKNDKTPLQDLIPNYKKRMEKQSMDLDLLLDTFMYVNHTSLDVILSKTLNTLRDCVVEYARILEQVLLAKKVLVIDAQNPRKKELLDIVLLAKERLNFYGGSDVIKASRFLARAHYPYLSEIEDRDVINHISHLQLEYATLALFVKKNQ